MSELVVVNTTTGAIERKVDGRSVDDLRRSEEQIVEPRVIESDRNAGRVEDDEISRLQAEIAQKRARALASLSELRERVHAATNWRTWMAAHPVAWIAAGMTLGFLVGYRSTKRSQ
jgi:hypothetical protein